MSKGNESPGLFRGIILAHLILLLHVLMVAAIGVLIIFFQGVVTYLPLILITGLTAISGSAYYLFRQLKARGKGLRDILNSPMFSGKSVEIRLLGGIASIKIDSSGGGPALPDTKTAGHGAPTEDNKTAHRREQIGIARVLEIDRVDPDAYNRAERKFSN